MGHTTHKKNELPSCESSSVIPILTYFTQKSRSFFQSNRVSKMHFSSKWFFTTVLDCYLVLHFNPKSISSIIHSGLTQFYVSTITISNTYHLLTSWDTINKILIQIQSLLGSSVRNKEILSKEVFFQLFNAESSQTWAEIMSHLSVGQLGSQADWE